MAASSVWTSLLATIPAPSPADDVVIGLPVDTGVHGRDLIVAARLMHEKHGHAGTRIAFEWRDDRRSSDGGAFAARALIERGIHFAVGHFHSGSALAAAPLYDTAGVLLFAPGSSHPDVTANRAGKCFRTCGRDDAQAELFAATLLAEDERPILLIEDIAYGRSLGDQIARRLRAAGREPLLVIATRPDDVTAIFPGPVAIAARHGFAAALLPKLVGRSVRLLSDDCYAVELIDSAGADCVGAYVAVLDIPSGPETDDLVRTYRAWMGREPNAYFLTSIAALDILLTAIREVGVEPGTVARKIRSRVWTTSLGSIRFDEAGDTKRLGWRWARIASGAVPGFLDPSEEG